MKKPKRVFLLRNEKKQEQLNFINYEKKPSCVLKRHESPPT